MIPNNFASKRFLSITASQSGALIRSVKIYQNYSYPDIWSMQSCGWLSNLVYFQHSNIDVRINKIYVQFSFSYVCVWRSHVNMFTIARHIQKWQDFEWLWLECLSVQKTWNNAQKTYGLPLGYFISFLELCSYKLSSHACISRKNNRQTWEWA